MNTRPCLGHFLRAATAASLLAGFTPDIFAQSSGQANPASAPAYELEITNGKLTGGGARHKADAPATPATLGNAINLLRELHPEANFVVAGGLENNPIADLKLRATTVDDQLEALRIASGSRFAWHAGGSGAAANAGPIDPTTGLPVNSGNRPKPILYVLDDSAETLAHPVLQVEAFNIAGYINLVSAGDSKEERAKRAEDQVRRIQEMVEITVHQYNDLSQTANSAKAKPLQMPVVQFHPGANLAILIGEPEAVAVASKVIGALPGAQRSVATDDPATKLENFFRGSLGGGGMGAGSTGYGGSYGNGYGGGTGRVGLGGGTLGAGSAGGGGGGGRVGGGGSPQGN